MPEIKGAKIKDSQNWGFSSKQRFKHFWWNIFSLFCRNKIIETKVTDQTKFNPLKLTVAIWVQLQSILCQTGLSRHL